MKDMTWAEGLTIAAIVGIVALVIASPFITGWLLWKAWLIVAVPAFGAPALTYWQAFWIGVAVWVVGGMFRATVSAQVNR